jgi:hypothetical protein
MTDELEPRQGFGADCVHFDTVQQLEAEGYALASRGDTDDAMKKFRLVSQHCLRCPNPCNRSDDAYPRTQLALAAAK